MIRVTGDTEINDGRLLADFRGFSFSNFKKADVRKQMTENMKRGRVEPACYWCAELVCAGHYGDIWEAIIHYMSKHIHIANPKMAVYLKMRYEVFRNLMIQSQNYVTSDIHMRNHASIRKIFAEIICNLALSNKKPSIEPIRINRMDEFDISLMTERLKAPSTRYGQHLFRIKDPHELLVPINELAFSLSSDGKSMSWACYWIEWIIEFDTLCKQRKETLKCVPRNYIGDPKSKTDSIWLVWDVFYDLVGNRNNPYLNTVVDALCELFCIKYTTACAKRRRYIFYFVVELLTEPVLQQGEIVADKNVLLNVTENINNIYKQIKVNEQRPNTDYLFSGLETENNFQNTIKKLEMLSSGF
jgi:hypothetical protein